MTDKFILFNFISLLNSTFLQNADTIVQLTFSAYLLYIKKKKSDHRVVIVMTFTREIREIAQISRISNS